MIIVLVGGIGNGKSLAAVKEIVDRQQRCYTNFDLHGVSYMRLKVSHLLVKEGETLKLNYSYWKARTKQRFDIYLDEFHNVMGSRRGMSKRNVLLSNWLSQMRKILGATELNNLYLITQKLRRIDVNSKDLAHRVILCTKQVFPDVLLPTIVQSEGKLVKRQLPLTIIYKHFFESAEALQAYEMYGVQNACVGVTRFVGNPYFKYYDSYEMIDFGAEDYL